MPPFGLFHEGNAENFECAREQLINELKLAPFVNGGGARKRLKCLACDENSAERKMFDCRGGKTCSVRYKLVICACKKYFFYRNGEQHDHAIQCTRTFRKIEEDIISLRGRIGRSLKSKQITSLKDRVKRKLGHTNKIGDLNGEPCLGSGTDADPFIVGFTNTAALRRYAEANTALNEKIMMHFDETFKVSEIRYQVIVFGLSDINGQFHLAGLAVSSHRRASEYKFLMSKFADALMKHEEIQFCPAFVMSDCSSAISNGVIAAIEECYESSPLILMCSFHVIKAVKAKLDEYPMQHDTKVALWSTQIKPVLNAMVKTKSDSEFSQKSKYLDETWLSNPVWSYWQTYHTPPGYTCTNNAVESFNKFFKRDYTLRRNHAIGMVMDLCIEALRDYTSAENRQKPFMTKRKYVKKDHDKVLELCRKMEVLRSNAHSATLKYKSKEWKCTVNLETQACSCRTYLYWAKCVHVPLAYYLLKKESPDGVPDMRKLRPRKKKTKATDSSGEEDENSQRNHKLSLQGHLMGFLGG
ncbi:hypothetical protein ROZALSC1DRAFT_31438, partial [Rozella allomycis CSF55]